MFVLSGERDGEMGVLHAFRRYREYLRSVESAFPPSAFALAVSDWYFDSRDHRCPHDAWIEEVRLTEHASCERPQCRTMALAIRLLGAYHDGFVEIRYPNVFAYSMRLENGRAGHGDWRYDEFRLSERGFLLHEIEFWGPEARGSWLIECSDVEMKWIPSSGSGAAG